MVNLLNRKKKEEVTPEATKPAAEKAQPKPETAKPSPDGSAQGGNNRKPTAKQVKMKPFIQFDCARDGCRYRNINAIPAKTFFGTPEECREVCADIFGYREEKADGSRGPLVHKAMVGEIVRGKKGRPTFSLVAVDKNGAPDSTYDPMKVACIDDVKLAFEIWADSFAQSARGKLSTAADFLANRNKILSTPKK